MATTSITYWTFTMVGPGPLYMSTPAPQTMHWYRWCIHKIPNRLKSLCLYSTHTHDKNITSIVTSVGRVWSLHLPWCGTPTDHTSTHLQPVLALCGIIRCNDERRRVHLPSYTQHSACTYLHTYIHSVISIIYTQCCLEGTWQSTWDDDQMHLISEGRFQ